MYFYMIYIHEVLSKRLIREKIRVIVMVTFYFLLSCAYAKGKKSIKIYLFENIGSSTQWLRISCRESTIQL